MDQWVKKMKCSGDSGVGIQSFKDIRVGDDVDDSFSGIFGEAGLGGVSWETFVGVCYQYNIAFVVINNAKQLKFIIMKY